MLFLRRIFSPIASFEIACATFNNILISACSCFLAKRNTIGSVALYGGPNAVNVGRGKIVTITLTFRLAADRSRGQHQFSSPAPRLNGGRLSFRVMPGLATTMRYHSQSVSQDVVAKRDDALIGRHLHRPNQSNPPAKTHDFE